MRLTPEKKKMLEDAVKKHDGTLRMSNAFRIYSSKDSAKNAVKTLESYDYVEYDKPGYFKVKRLPQELSHLEENIKDEDLQGRDFVQRLIEQVFRKINNQRPSVDPEKVKYATEKMDE